MAVVGRQTRPNMLSVGSFPSGRYCVVSFSFSLLILSVLTCTSTASLSASTCESVAKVFSAKVASASQSGADIPAVPIADASLLVCSDTLAFTGGASCCSRTMEETFVQVSPEYLRAQIKARTNDLETRITQSRQIFQDHLRQTMVDTRNRTAETLEKMFALPQEEHQGVIDTFIGRLDQFFQGSDQHPPEEIVVKLFADLFPFVYQHVLTGPAASAAARDTSGGGDPSQGQLEPAAQDCLRQEFAKVQPFGTLPTVLGKRMKYALQRARAYTETLDVLLTAISMANSGATVHKSCSRAISRLRFCSMCPGEQQTRACRGLCLNVMRGCLSKVAEVSSAWDELIIAFENLNMGVRSRHDAQEMLAGLGANVTGAVVDAFNQKQRIHNEVMSACRQSSLSLSNRAPRSSLAIPGERQPSGSSLKSLSPSEDHFTRQKSMRTDLETLITVLEDSKGFLLQLPDSLCRMPALYDMEMDSDRCWNGSAVGRYMHSVPEENMISQVQHNKEVTLSLVPDYRVLEVKDLLVHMSKNLSSLENEEKMLSDESYSRIDASLGSGSGYSGSSIDSNELTIDDEDNVDDSSRMYSGSGSGDFGTYDYGPDNTDEEDYSQFSAEIGTDSTGKPTRGPGGDSGRRPAPDWTTKQEKGKDSSGKRKPSSKGKNSGRDGNMDRGSASTTTTSLTLLLAVAFTSCVFGRNKVEWIMQIMSHL